MTQPVNHTSPEDVPREIVKVRKKSVLREYTEAILVAVLLALLIRTFVVQAFKIPSGSMIPTLLVGDHILVNKFVYRFTAPKRGDVIVFKYPVDESRDFIKRIIAVGGEDLNIKDQKIYVNCKPPEPSCRPIDDPWGKWEDRFGISESTSVKVPPDSYFVMGDNRNNSQDSRYWGFVKRDKIKGRAFLIYWSWDSEQGRHPGACPVEPAGQADLLARAGAGASRKDPHQPPERGIRRGVGFRPFRIARGGHVRHRSCREADSAGTASASPAGVAPRRVRSAGGEHLELEA